jgi:hypothetical protein
MILFDFSQVVVGAALEYHARTKELIDVPLLRHISLNNILGLKDKLHKYSDEIVLCLDGRNYWRKKIFPYYKQNRKKSQEKQTFDWKTFHESFNIIKQEFTENLPYKVIEVEGAEADDIIAVLCTIFGNQRDVVVVSSDKDLLQIQMNLASRVKQYSPFHKKFLQADYNSYSLFEHVVKGDPGDGIPNILSDDDVFLCEGKRSRPIRSSQIEAWSKFGLDNPEGFCNDLVELEKFRRNRTLIDLRMIPKEVIDSIASTYQDTQTHVDNTFNYLVKHKMRKILERGGF